MPHHIVIVEDEPVTQARLQSYFTQEGYTVSVTASGAGLREIMQNQPVDLILLDINLPDENGLMLTRALREPRQPGGCKLKTAPVRPVVAARPAE
ncbi:response regulator, partial [Escherichia coli]|nr:response regulator [Escherichia coli]